MRTKTYNVNITVDNRGRAYFSEAVELLLANTNDLRAVPTNSRRVAREINKAKIVIK